jgi:predicted nucleotidyltransferase
MRPDDPNLPHLRVIAEALGELREQVVFLGGAVVGLLVSDPLAESVRATYDVDAVVDLDWSRFRRLEERMHVQGFTREMESGVVCRWIHRASGVIFDLMPVNAGVLGFSNPWYAYAVETARPVQVGDHLSIQLVTAVAFVATKLEAFTTRGRGDFLSSHDLEDVLNVIDGRHELVAEMAAAPAELRGRASEVFAALLDNPAFVNALPGLIAEAGRMSVVLGRLQAMVVERS